MGDAAVQDVDPFHTAVDGVYTALHFGDHATGDDSRLHQGRNLLGADHVDEGTLVLGVSEEPPDIGEQNQLFRPPGPPPAWRRRYLR